MFFVVVLLYRQLPTTHFPGTFMFLFSVKLSQSAPRCRRRKKSTKKEGEGGPVVLCWCQKFSLDFQNVFFFFLVVVGIYI